MRLVATVIAGTLIIAILWVMACVGTYRWLALYLLYDGDKALRNRKNAGY